MANVYNSYPIQIDTAMASGWKALQSLVPAANAVGFRVTKVLWQGPVTLGDKFIILDSNDSALILLQGTCGAASADVPYDFNNREASWRDFKVTRIDSGLLLIWYK